MKAVLKYGKKQFTVDVNRRDTYHDSMASRHEPSVLTTFEGELKQLTVVCAAGKFVSYGFFFFFHYHYFNLLFIRKC